MKYGNYEVRLIDDGTLDTIISVNGKQFRYSQDFAGEYRDATSGALGEDGFFALADIAIADYEEEEAGA